MGRWWDESWYMEKAHTSIELLKQGNLSHPFWYKYGSDHPLLTSYGYGVMSYLDRTSYDPNATSSFIGMPKGVPQFTYDYTYTRLLSVLFSSLSVVLVFFIGARYFSLFVGIVAAMILAMLPHFLGLSQLVVLESWIMFFFTACVYTYLLFLETKKRRYLILTGILTGLCLQVKQSNILIFVFFVVTFFLWKKITKNKSVSYSHLGIITLLAIATSIIIYPQPLFNPLEFISFSYGLWFHDSGMVPERLFGIPMLARWFFYPVAVLVTTPLIIMLLGGTGIFVSISERKKWVYIALLIWLFVPFLMMLFHFRQNMVRYIIQFYAPLALLAAIGFEFIIQRFTKSNFLKYSLITPLFVYLMMILIQITPYYLNYFNELVGGTKNVYEKRLFFLGWFGEGLKRPGEYIATHAEKNARIGMALNPHITLFKVPSLRYEMYDPKKQYDYVVVNYFNIIRLGFDESVLNKDYTVVYVEKADGAELAKVYKHK